MTLQQIYARPGKAVRWRLALDDLDGLVDLTGFTPVIRFTPTGHAEITVDGVPRNQVSHRGEVEWSFILDSGATPGDYAGWVDVDDFRWPLDPKSPLRVIVVDS